MGEDIILGNKIILSKKYKNGSVYLVEFPANLFVVIGLNENEQTIVSRSFPFTEQYKKEVKKSATTYFKQIKECIYQQKLNIIEEMELL